MKFNVKISRIQYVVKKQLDLSTFTGDDHLRSGAVAVAVRVQSKKMCQKLAESEK